MTLESLPLISCSGIPLCQSSTRAERPRIRGRSVTPNRVNKWQMLWNSFSSVTTETVSTWKQRPNMENRFSLCRRSRTGTFCCLQMHTTKIQIGITKAGFEWFICLAHGLTEPEAEIKRGAKGPRPFHAFSWVLGQSSLCWRMPGSCRWLQSKLFVFIYSILISFEPLFLFSFSVCIFWIVRSKATFLVKT